MPKTKKKSNLPEKINNLSLKNSVYETKFKGFGEDLLMGLIYLNLKHNNFYFPIDKKTLENSALDMMWKILLSWKCGKNGKLGISLPIEEKKYFNKIKSYIQNYKKGENKLKKFIIIPLYLGVKSCDITKGHFNICIINMENMEMERFEPYGYGVTTNEHLKVDKNIEKLFNEKGINIKFVSPYKFLPKISLQQYEESEGSDILKSDPGGFCGAWGLWYINLRLKYPNTDSKKLILRAIKLIKGKKNFKNFIRNYSAFLVRMRENMLSKSLSQYSNKSLTTEIDTLLKKRNPKLLKNHKEKYVKKTKKYILLGGKTEKKSLKLNYNLTSNPFSKKNILNFIKSESLKLKCNILGEKTKDFLGAGVANTVLLGCLDMPECKEKIAVRIMPVSREYLRNKNHPIDTELSLYDILVDLNKKNILPHVPFKFNWFECHYNKLFGFLSNKDMKLSKHQKLLVKIKNYIREKIISEEIHRKLGILILEYCQHGNLEDYLESNKTKLEYIRNIIFQILISLSTMQYHIPGFKHNDLHDNNILIGRFNFKDEEKYLENLKNKKEKPKYFIHYKMFDNDYYIPYLGYCAKIFDFDISCSETHKNNKLDKKLYKQNGITNKSNPVFDFHLFMNISFNDFIFDKKIPKTLQDFYNRNIPYEFRGKRGSYLGFGRLTNFEQTWDYEKTNLRPPSIKTPSELILLDEFFKDYREKPKSGEVIMSYDTKIPKLEKINNRKDMF